MKFHWMLASVVGAVGFAAAANADMIIQNFTFPDDLVSTTPTVTAAPFHAGTGTLTSVEVITTGASNAVVTFFNFSGGPAPFTAGGTSGPVTLTGPGVSVAKTVSVSGLAGTLSPVTTEQLFPDTGPGTSMASDTTFTSSIPAAYTGAVGIPFTLTGGTYSSSASFTGFIFVGGDALPADVGLEVIYNFTPVPEPASLALLAMGTAGLLARRRRA